MAKFCRSGAILLSYAHDKDSAKRLYHWLSNVLWWCSRGLSATCEKFCW